jgi:hypothetical protein
LLPCGHAILCRWCAAQHMAGGLSAIRHGGSPPQCPLCRKPIRQKV